MVLAVISTHKEVRSFEKRVFEKSMVKKTVSNLGNSAERSKKLGRVLFFDLLFEWEIQNWQKVRNAIIMYFHEYPPTTCHTYKPRKKSLIISDYGSLRTRKVKLCVND